MKGFIFVVVFLGCCVAYLIYDELELRKMKRELEKLDKEIDENNERIKTLLSEEERK